jgi:hypothetical protein
MIKPQPKVRPVVMQLEGRIEEGSRVSIDSMNNPVPPRINRRDGGVAELDFIAVKAGFGYH